MEFNFKKEVKMLNIDLGGQKHKRTLGIWKIMDINPKADFIYDINSKKEISLESESVNNFYASMVLEHVYPSILPFLLSELKRTLKKNGILRIVVPDGEKAIKWFLKNPELLKQSGLPSKPSWYPPTKAGYLLSWFFTEDKKTSSGHKNLFDDETMKYLLEKQKFNVIKKLCFNKCSPIFNGKDYKRYKNYSLYYEVKK